MVYNSTRESAYLEKDTDDLIRLNEKLTAAISSAIYENGRDVKSSHLIQALCVSLSSVIIASIEDDKRESFELFAENMANLHLKPFNRRLSCFATKLAFLLAVSREMPKAIAADCLINEISKLRG